MLRELHVSHLALIEEARLEFGPGLNVLTGETGAGKTVLVEALGLLLGGRGDSGLLRQGAQRLELEAGFEVAVCEGLRSLAEEEGMELEDGQIIVRRVMSGDGKSRCYVNGRMCTVGALSRLGERLVDIHGQHEHQRLRNPSSHVEYLDAYGDDAHAELLSEYRETYAGWVEVHGKLGACTMDDAQKLREIDLLRFQVQEIEEAQPGEGELEELLKERKRMQNREELFTAVRGAYECIVGGEMGEGAIDRLGDAEAALAKAYSLDEDLHSWTTGLRDTQGRMTDLAHEMHDYAESLDFEPGRLEEVEARLRILSGLARKYGRDGTLILEHLERSRRRLSELEDMDSQREDLLEEAGRKEAALREIGGKLTVSRRELAERLGRETNRELDELNMAGMRFRVDVAEEQGIGERGSDAVEFKVSPGRGLPYRPIARIASGGELSRIMLALKLSLARADAVPTLVFDEVDAGIGGTTADVLAAKLSRISRYHQVFSITHLPQIAALSDRHMSVNKRETPQGIVTEVCPLTGTGKVEELVRMLGGDESTARKHARSMLKRKVPADI